MCRVYMPATVYELELGHEKIKAFNINNPEQKNKKNF